MIYMAIRQIKHYKKSDILRMKAKKVNKIDERTRLLISDMVDTMYHEQGVGLAAPQVGVLKRIIVVDIGEGVHALINPEIISKAGESVEYEGCLSIPGIKGKVARPAKVVVKALNPEGEEIEIKAEGLMARALCHEIDHLDGVLFIDKMIPETNEVDG
jgi:peptide deformylase